MKKKIKRDKVEPYKISATIYTNEELEKLDYKIGNELDKIVHQVTEAVLTNREHIVLQKVIEKQQKEIEELKGNNKELFEEYNKRVSTIIDYEQGLKEIIDEEDDPDTWAYHAVKKLLEEVGGIEYE